MLTAENRTSPTEIDTATGPTTVPVGFGKVLNSVQGLQQRLNDFSFEEVSEIETNAKTLIQGLSRLQIKLECLVTLKDAVSKAREMIDQVPDADYSMIGPDSLVNHPGLHAIVNADKLIRLHKILKLAKESADSVTFDPLGPAQPRAIGPVPRTSPDSRPNRLRPFADLAIASSSAITRTPTTTVADPARAAGIAPDKLSDARSIGDGQRAEDDDQTSQFTAPAEEQETDSGIGGLPFQTPQFDASVLAPEQYDSSETPTEAALAIKRAMGQAPDPMPNTPSESERETSKSSKSNQDHFDQRLLDELIQNYGEFKITPENPKSVDKSFRPEPNFVAAETPPTVETLLPEQQANRVTAISNQGEIDLRLKKIIKDYGEYDKYSNRSSATLKKGGIAAVIVLALALAGFYFLRTSSKSPTPVDRPASQTSVGADSSGAAAKTDETGVNIQGDDRNNSKNQSTDSVEKKSKSATTQTQP